MSKQSPAARTRSPKSTKHVPMSQAEIEGAAALLSRRSQYLAISMPVGPRGLICAATDSSPHERQQLALCVLDTVGNLLTQFPYEEGDNQVLAYHIVWACQWLTALGRGLLDSLDLPQEGE